MRVSVCVSHAYHPRPRRMLTLRSCDASRSWRSEFDFYVASAEQQHSRQVWKTCDEIIFYCSSIVQHLTLCDSVPHFSISKCLEVSWDDSNLVCILDRKLYFAQHTISPYPSRVCEGPPGCVFSSGPDGPTQGSFYAPLPAGTGTGFNVFGVVHFI